MVQFHVAAVVVVVADVPFVTVSSELGVVVRSVAVSVALHFVVVVQQNVADRYEAAAFLFVLPLTPKNYSENRR